MRARSGASATPRGGGMRRTTASSSSGTLLPSLAEMRRISSGFVPMSSCSSCARRSGSAPGRSILLSTGMISSPASIARNRLERARHLVGEVHVPGGVDQIELVHAPVARMVVHAHRVQLDRDAALALQVHRVEHLLSHQALVQGARELDQAVGQGRLPMVDMGHNTEVADVILAHVREKYRRYL